MNNNLIVLKTIANVKNGFAFKSKDYTEDGIRIIRITNVQKGHVVDSDPKFISKDREKEVQSYLLNENDILISLTGNVGRVAMLEEKHKPAALNQRVGCIRPISDEVHNQYLFQYLNSNYFENLAIKNSKGVAQLNLSSKWIEEHKIPLPEKNDQIRIATLLSRIEALIATRKANLNLLDEFLKSTFLEMFGDPSFMKSQNLGVLDNYIAFLTSGSRGWAKYYTDKGDVFLRINNVRDASLKLDDLVYVEPPDSAEAVRTKTREGDLLLSITADLGRTAVITKEIAGAFINQHLSLIRLNQNKLNPMYVAWFYAMPFGRAIINRKNREGVKAGLNFDDIRGFGLFVPPIIEQNEFSKIVTKVESIKSLYQKNLTNLENLYGSVSQKAFKGELDLSKIPLPDKESKEETIETPPVYTKSAPDNNIDTEFTYLKTNKKEQQLLCSLFNKYLNSHKGKKFTFDDYFFYWSHSEKTHNNIFGLADYELIKKWLYQLINKGTIQQVFDDEKHELVLKLNG